MKKSYLFLVILLSIVCLTGNAYADDTVFSGLADKASKIGRGLRDSGFLIAGFGLIVFSFMAIFNKISWKMLAYIMFSTFILSTMVGVIGYISNYQSSPRFSDIQSTGPGGESQDQTQAVVDKEGGNPSLGEGTAPMKLSEFKPVSITELNQQELDKQVNSLLNQPLQPIGQENDEDKSQKYDDISKKAQELGGTRPQPFARIESDMNQLANKGDKAGLEDKIKGAQAALDYLNSLPPEAQNNEDIQKLKDYQQKAIEYANQGLKKIEENQNAE